jgi:predicted RNase H-like HicB family nuclease
VKASDLYLKIVEWSEEDGCYVGSCPGLMLGGVHGEDEVKVYRELCRAVEDWIEIQRRDHEPFLRPRRGRNTQASSFCESARDCMKSCPSRPSARGRA